MKVIELAHVASGPFTGMLLADLGADVVKVEPPGGDQMRQWPPLATDSTGNQYSLSFASLNRNKRSVTADLKDPQQLEFVTKLCLESDVLIENYRPGVLDRLGLGFERLREEHRGLVYCSISGFGAESPRAHEGAFDVVIQAASGLMSVTGEPDGPPVKSGVPIADFAAGLYAAYTIAAMLPSVRAGGPSSHIDCPMFDCMLAISALQTSDYWGSGTPPARLGSAHPRNAPYQAFEANDGYFAMAAGNNSLWQKVCCVLHVEHLTHDARFAEVTTRAANQRELASILQEHFATQTCAHWLRAFRDCGVPCAPVNTFADALADQHVVDTQLVQEILVPVAGPSPTVIYPARISGLDARLDMSPPVLGADTANVRQDWGIH